MGVPMLNWAKSMPWHKDFIPNGPEIFTTRLPTAQAGKERLALKLNQPEMHPLPSKYNERLKKLLTR